MAIQTTDETFEKDVILRSSEVPVLVDFWADWCGPCRMLTPLLEKLDEEYGNRFLLVKAEVDKNEANAQKYGVMSIPSVKLIKNGEIVDEFMGSIPEAHVREFLDKNLK